MITIARGSKLGIHTLQRGGPVLFHAAECKRRGFRMPLVKAVDNGGIAIDAKKIDPAILTITRKVNIDEDGCQFVSDGQVDIINLRKHAQAAVDFPIKGRGNIRPLSKEELDAADWLEVLNEADPPGVQGWKNFGMYLCEVVNYATQMRVPIAIPGTNLGTPEWDEMQALVNTGLFKLMKQSWSDPRLKHGHIWTAHEGVLPGSNNPMVFGPIPGSPIVPGAGPTAYRYRFLYKLLADRGEIVPLVISEFYAPGGYSAGNVDNIVAKMAEYDREIRKDSYVLATLPFTMAGAPGDWGDQDYTFAYTKIVDYMQTIKDFDNGTIINPVPAPVPPPSTSMKFLVGVHGRAEGRLAEADLIAITRSRVEAVKLMSTATPEDVDKLRAIKPDMFIIVRLFESFKDRHISPADFVSHQIDITSVYYKMGIRYFEIHNEPNLYAEGLGSSWNNGKEFGDWFLEVYRMLKSLWSDIQIGFPGLSPGQDVTWEHEGKSGYTRYNQNEFLSEASAAVNRADWVGVHCYFVSDWDMTIPEWGGLNYQVFQRMFPMKRLYITEFSSPTDEPASIKAERYVKYLTSLRSSSNVGAAFCYILSGHDWEKEAWRLENGNLTAIPDRIGAYMSTPIATGLTHTVTASILNVRQFPWLSTAEPPLNGQLKGGDKVRSYGSVILPGMLFGWHLINPLGNQWISGRYLKPAV